MQKTEQLTIKKIDIRYPFLRNWLYLLGSCFDGLNPVLFYDLFRDKTDSFMLMAAELDGRFAGAMCVRLVPDEKWAFLMLLAVEPEYRSYGIGSAMLEWLKDFAVQGQMDGICFEVLKPDNFPEGAARERAVRRQAFYRRSGAENLEGWHSSTLLPEAEITLAYDIYGIKINCSASPEENIKSIIPWAFRE